MRHAICALAAALFNAPALAQTGDHYRDLDTATEALFETYGVTAGDPYPVPEAVGAETPISFSRAQALAAGGANFAGRHVLTVIGCGSECQASHVLNPSPGDGFASLVSGHGVDFRDDSALIILNPPAELTYFGPDEVPARLRPQCLVYADGRFDPVSCEGYPG